MSHFTVLLVGGNVEDQLAPYDENIQTAPRREGEVSDEEKQHFIDHYVEKHPELKGKSFDELYKQFGDDWNGSTWKKSVKGDVWYEYTTYNPDSKWDWYQIGGRWTGFFKLKPSAVGETGRPGLMTEKAPEGTADSALKRDIDFEGMEAEERAKAEAQYDKVMAIFGNAPVNKLWGEFLALPDLTIDEKREQFWNQDRCILWKGNEELSRSFYGSPDDFAMSKEDYVNAQVSSAYSTFAMVYDGKWYEKGEMGWFGMAHNEMDQGKWDEEVRKLIQSLPDDTLLTIVDCHI